MARCAVALLLAVAIAAVLLQPPTTGAQQEKPAMTAESILDTHCKVSKLCAYGLGSECTQVVEKAKNVCERKEQELVEKDKEGHYVKAACEKVMEYGRRGDVDQLMQDLCGDHLVACSAREQPPVPEAENKGIIEMCKKPVKLIKKILPEGLDWGKKLLRKWRQKVPVEVQKGINDLSSLCEKLKKSGESKDEL